MRRGRELSAVRGRLEVVLGHAAVGSAVDEVLAEVAADPDALDGLLEEQHYRLAYWRTAARELDYRRFFDIDGLVGVRVEDPDVFRLTHERVLAWLQDGSLDGVRIDHPDGLRRPAAYLERLRERAPDAWIVVEKILERDETLPAPGPWPAPPATTPPTTSSASSWIRPPRSR